MVEVNLKIVSYFFSQLVFVKGEEVLEQKEDE